MGILFPSMHSGNIHGERTNYTVCKLCGGEMLYDSCSQVCGREQCRRVLMFIGEQKQEYRQEFWQRFDAAPREATAAGLKLWDLEQMMADATDEMEPAA